MPKHMIRQKVRCQNPGCPSQRHGEGALACELERPARGAVAVRWRCRRCRTEQRVLFRPLAEEPGPAE